ncbi:MAG TPA: hypothetical protein VGC76_09295 [Pyrinomonadaceae bacterium]
MRSKHIAALITFFATFAFSAFIALLFSPALIYQVPPVKNYEFRSSNNRCRKDTGYKIKTFLEQDKRNGISREKSESVDSSDFSKRAELINQYYFESSSMNVSDFPRDFQAAWSEHMNAWRNYGDFMEQEAAREETSDNFRQNEYELVSDISTTWYEVLRVGREYGADFPNNF